MRTADRRLPIDLWAVYWRENLTLSHVHILSKRTYLNIVLVSFCRHVGSFSFQNGSNQLSENTVVNTQYVFTFDVHVLV